jgi:hypothetical protein
MQWEKSGKFGAMKTQKSGKSKNSRFYAENIGAPCEKKGSLDPKKEGKKSIAKTGNSLM